AQALARPRRHLLAALRELGLERLGVATELVAQLLDLAAKIARRRLARVLLVLVARELLSLRLRRRRGRAGALVDRRIDVALTRRRVRRLTRVRRDPLGRDELRPDLLDVLAVRRGLAHHA